MERNFENLKNEIIKAIKHFDVAMKLYKNDIASSTNKQKIKLYERYIDRDFHARTEMELVLRKFYSWSEIDELEK